MTPDPETPEKEIPDFASFDWFLIGFVFGACFGAVIFCLEFK